MAEYFRAPILGIVTVCMLISLLECAVDESVHADGFRILCRTAVAASVVTFTASCLQVIL